MSSSRDLRPSRPSVSGEVDQVDTAEALFLDGAFEELEGGVAAVLFDDEEVDAGLVAGLDHAHAVLPAGGHGLFGHDVDAVAGGTDGLFRVQAAGGAQGDLPGERPASRRRRRCRTLRSPWYRSWSLVVIHWGWFVPSGVPRWQRGSALGGFSCGHRARLLKGPWLARGPVPDTGWTAPWTSA